MIQKDKEILKYFAHKLLKHSYIIFPQDNLSTNAMHSNNDREKNNNHIVLSLIDDISPNISSDRRIKRSIDSKHTHL